jgi:hypothetical protein
MVQLIFLGMCCLIGVSGCGFDGTSGCSEGDAQGQLFSKAKPQLETCQRLFDLNGGKEPNSEQWKKARSELVRLTPRIIPTRRGKVLLFEIINHPLDSYEAFLYIPQGAKVEDYLEKQAWFEIKPATKKLAENWYWIAYDS